MASAIMCAIGINLGGRVGTVSGFIGAVLLSWIAVLTASLKPSIPYSAMLVADGVFSLFVACRVVGRLVGGAQAIP